MEASQMGLEQRSRQPIHPVTNNDIDSLRGVQQPPCLSIYLPLQRAYPERHQGPTRYRHLIEEAEKSLRRKYPARQTEELLAKFRPIADDDTIWTQPGDGLAVLGSPNRLEVFELQRPVPERAIVASSFHLKPLLRIVQSADRFHVLCLQREGIRLYEGNRDGLRPITPAGVPLTVTEALGAAVGVQRKEQTHPGKSRGESRPAPRGPNVPPGHAASRDDAKLDAERFFRAVDRAVWEQVSRPSGLPLVIVALPEQQAVFRQISNNPQLLETGISSSPEALSDEQLRGGAWKCVEPKYLARLQKMIDDFKVARVRGMASEQVDDVGRAAHDGRVGILLVEAERVLPGRLDETSGAPQHADLKDPNAGDILDDLADLVLQMKGNVVVVPAERMPAATGVAAIYRF